MEFLLSKTEVFSPRQHKNIDYKEWYRKKYPEISVNVNKIFSRIKITTNITLQQKSYFVVLKDC